MYRRDNEESSDPQELGSIVEAQFNKKQAHGIRGRLVQAYDNFREHPLQSAGKGLSKLVDYYWDLGAAAALNMAGHDGYAILTLYAAAPLVDYMRQKDAINALCARFVRNLMLTSIISAESKAEELKASGDFLKYLAAFSAGGAVAEWCIRISRRKGRKKKELTYVERSRNSLKHALKDLQTRGKRLY